MSVWSWLKRLTRRGAPDGPGSAGSGPVSPAGEAKTWASVGWIAEARAEVLEGLRREAAGLRGETSAKEIG